MRLIDWGFVGLMVKVDAVYEIISQLVVKQLVIQTPRPMKTVVIVNPVVTL